MTFRMQQNASPWDCSDSCLWLPVMRLASQEAAGSPLPKQMSMHGYAWHLEVLRSPHSSEAQCHTEDCSVSRLLASSMLTT